MQSDATQATTLCECVLLRGVVVFRAMQQMDKNAVNGEGDCETKERCLGGGKKEWLAQLVAVLLWRPRVGSMGACGQVCSEE